jgi:hypothetical protein
MPAPPHVKIRFRIDDRVIYRGRTGVVWELRANGYISVRWDGVPEDAKGLLKTHVLAKNLRRYSAN